MPAIRVEMPNRQVAEMARRAAASLDSQRQAIQQKIAGIVRGLVAEAFQVKSHGGTGSDGITWMPDRPETMRHKRTPLIGVESGELENSLRVTATGSRGGTGQPDIVVAFTSDHAEFFNRQRNLLPDHFPGAWAAAIEGPVADWTTLKIKQQTETNAPFLGGL